MSSDFSGTASFIEIFITVDCLEDASITKPFESDFEIFNTELKFK